MKTYDIPIVWQSYKRFPVQAELKCLHKLIKIAKNEKTN